MKPIPTVAALLALALAAACIPVLPHRYAMGEAEGGIVLTSKCWGMKDTLRFEREGVGVEVRLLKRGDEGWLLEERFDVPAGKTVKLVGTDLRIFDRKRKDDFRVPFSGMNMNGNPTLPLAPIAPLVGGQQPLLPSSPLHFWLYANAGEHDPDGILMALPPYTVNGVVVELPTIRFTHKTDFQVAAPLLC